MIGNDIDATIRLAMASVERIRGASIHGSIHRIIGKIIIVVMIVQLLVLKAILAETATWTWIIRSINALMRTGPKTINSSSLIFTFQVNVGEFGTHRRRPNMKKGLGVSQITGILAMHFLLHIGL